MQPAIACERTIPVAECRHGPGAGFGRRLAGLVAALALLAPGAVAAQQGGGLRVVPVTLMHADMAALNGFIPVGWQAQGGLTWGDNCTTYGYNIAWHAASPDGGRQGIAMLPGLGWGLDPLRNCAMQPDVAGLRELLDFQAQHLWPGARMLDFLARPDLLGGQPVPAEVPGMAMAMPGMKAHAWVDAGAALFAFAGPGGEDMRGVILGSGFFNETLFDPSDLMLDMSEFPGLESYLPPPPPAQTMRTGGSDWGFAAWAPAGQLDLVAAEALQRSFIATGEWSDFIMQHRAVIDRQNLGGIAERGEIRRRTSEEIAAMSSHAYNERMALMDRQQRETVEAIRGVETYLDTSGRPVQLDHNYRNAWQLADGSFVLTNDAGFDPVATLGIAGQQLQVAP